MNLLDDFPVGNLLLCEKCDAKLVRTHYYSPAVQTDSTKGAELSNASVLHFFWSNLDNIVKKTFLLQVRKEKRKEISVFLKNEKANDTWVTILFTRLSLEINEVTLFIDSAQTEENMKLGIHDFYISCGCRAKTQGDIFKALEDGIFEKYGLTKDSLLFPVPSKVMEFIYSDNEIFSLWTRTTNKN